MTANIDYADLIGVPFEYGGRGPDKLDCYGLVMLMHKRIGKEIPDYRSPDVLDEIATLLAQEKYKWTACAQQTDDNDAIPFSEMQVGRVLEIRVNGLACHVGMIHRPRYFLHTWENSGGVVESAIEEWRPRILGVYEYAS